jgi:hypothetical protein
MELFSIERPDYVDPGIVPYVDWGRGFSPVYRDTSYPILAIAWERAVQLLTIYKCFLCAGKEIGHQLLVGHIRFHEMFQNPFEIVKQDCQNSLNSYYY